MHTPIELMPVRRRPIEDAAQVDLDAIRFPDCQIASERRSRPHAQIAVLHQLGLRMRLVKLDRNR
ncbi:MAG: hypothetical protein GYB68_14790 [Chloroflexi bacterium]|nr:hypothetical protein [Chloroflexota bacterium]